MNKLLSVIALGACLSFGAAQAQDKSAAMAAPAAGGTCATKAMDKNGKPLVGAAKTANMKKCMEDSVGM